MTDDKGKERMKMLAELIDLFFTASEGPRTCYVLMATEFEYPESRVTFLSNVDQGDAEMLVQTVMAGMKEGGPTTYGTA